MASYASRRGRGPLPHSQTRSSPSARLNDPHVVSFSPTYHWTDHNIRVHLFTCVPTLQLAHLMRREADRGGLRTSVRELLGQLASIGETVLIYPSAGGSPRPDACSPKPTREQDQLAEIFQLHRWAPRS